MEVWQIKSYKCSVFLLFRQINLWVRALLSAGQTKGQFFVTHLSSMSSILLEQRILFSGILLSGNNIIVVLFKLSSNENNFLF